MRFGDDGSITEEDLLKLEEIERRRKQEEDMAKASRDVYAQEAGGMDNLVAESYADAQETLNSMLPEEITNPENKDFMQEEPKAPMRKPASLDKPVEDVVKTAEANQDAKSPYQKTKGELEKDQPIKEEDDLMTKYRKLMEQYEAESGKPMEGPSVMDALPDILSGLYNIGVRAKGGVLPELNVPSGIAAQQKRQQQGRQQKLQSLDKLRSMVNELSGMQDKRTTAQAKMKQAEKEAKATKAKPTEGEKVVDREFAKEYNKWTTGGKADYEVNSKIFKEAIKDLEEGKVDTGPLEGIGARTPIIRTDARAMEDRVRKAINSMLRATLGAQFTEKEGERIFAQTFDPFKSSEDNIRAMQLELDKIEKRKDAIEDMGSYYEKKKTLAGYNAPKVKEEAEPAQEVERKTKDGRIAVFDAKTKKFLRYKD